MDISGFEKQYPGWKVDRRIGVGSFGMVYKISRDLFGTKEYAALKHIRIPPKDDELDELFASGYDEVSISAHYESCLADIIREYALMSQMKGHPNIVYCDDVKYIPREDSFGWDIFIKMELLTPLLKYIGKNAEPAQVIKLGMDICMALIRCKELNIVHRDIKPQNIFVSRSGEFKLGDFGIAKTIERTRGGTKMGTINYMAPEVHNNQPYGTSVDVYSLGIVMYWMLNECKLPFLPLTHAVPTVSEQENALYRRFSGEEIQEPKNGSAGLKRIVLKACAFDPKERYASAADMLQDLKLLGDTGADGEYVVIDPHAQLDKTSRKFPAKPNVAEEQTEHEENIVAAEQIRPEVVKQKTATAVHPKSEKTEQIPAAEEQMNPRVVVQNEKRKLPYTKGVLIFGIIAIIAVLLLLLKSCGGVAHSEMKPQHEMDVATSPTYEMLNGHCYYIFDEPLADYEAAAAFCEKLGGFLADVTSEEETMFLHGYLTREGYDHVFLGGTDALVDGNWKWESGAPFEYQNWNEGEPNNDLGGEDHLAMYRVLEDGSWNDINFEMPSAQIKDVTVIDIAASSYCADNFTKCTAQNILDGDTKTVWCVASDSVGIGEYVQFMFAQEERITGFTIQSGIPADEGAVCLIKKLRLNFSDGSQQIITLGENAEPQNIQLEEAVKTDSIKIVFEEVYDGSEIGRIALSELVFHTEERKTGFVCEWESENLAKAGLEKYKEQLTSYQSIETTTPPETAVPPETLPIQAEFTDWADTLPEYVTSTDYVIEEQTLYSTQKLEKTISTESDQLEGWTLVDTITNPGEYGPWSDWSSQKISESDTRKVDTQTRYRYKTKDTTTSSSSAKDGWELYDTTYSWGDYGNWSDWTTTSVSGSDTRQVETKTQYSYRDKWVTQEYSDWSDWSNWSWTRESTSDLKKEESKNFYGYYYFQCRSCGAHMPYSTPCETWGGGCGATNNNYWNEIWSATSWDNAGLYKWHGTRKLATYEINGSLTFKWDNGDGGPKLKYRYATRTLENVTNYGSWSDYSDTAYSSNSTREVRTRTVYHYRDCVQIPTYHFYRWGGWSDWSTKSVSENSDRKVETKKYYRYQDKITETTYCFERWADWSAFTTETAEESAEQKVQTKKQYRYRSKTVDEKRNPYTDVEETAFGFDAIMWVTEQGIMNGTSADTFAPDGHVTRGQMVMMLWRAAGKPIPEAADCPYQDVLEDSVFHDAVMWATQEGIASGATADAFGLNDPCIRSHAITFLYRVAGKPEVVLKQEPFIDVEAGAFYYEPVLWAYENNISSGISATEFGIEEGCTRIQAAIMLHRIFADQ